MLTVHHLRKSQSERIVWLCEELGLDYTLKCYERDPLLAPPEYRALHPIGTAPVITDGDVVLAESGAMRRLHHRETRQRPSRAAARSSGFRRTISSGSTTPTARCRCS